MRRPGTLIGRSDPFLDFHVAKPIHAREGTPDREWRFMDTAPRDGTPILVWVKWQNAPHSPAIVAFEMKDWVRVGMKRTIAEAVITHWMALPQGPEPHDA
ncbi:hypothetical protein JNW90_13220 [Micromonospora sp. STR1s_5]|nr:hypothetical protein [Micromonospora sp. STR1s_5]